MVVNRGSLTQNHQNQSDYPFKGKSSSNYLALSAYKTKTFIISGKKSQNAINRALIRPSAAAVSKAIDNLIRSKEYSIDDLYTKDLLLKKNRLGDFQALPIYQKHIRTYILKGQLTERTLIVTEPLSVFEDLSARQQILFKHYVLRKFLDNGYCNRKMSTDEKNIIDQFLEIPIYQREIAFENLEKDVYGFKFLKGVSA